MIAVMIGGVCAMIVSLFGTRYLITFFRNRGKGQPILGKEDRGPEHHLAKQGTPTMGGLAIVVSAFFGWVVAHFRHGLVFSNQATIVWVGILALSGMGFLDDYIKINKAHNRGIFWKKKSYITLAISMGIAWWLVAATGVSETISFTRYDWPGWHVPWPVWVIFAGVTIWATANAVNVTDGLDGLAAGAGLLGFLAFTIIAYWAFRNPVIYGVGGVSSTHSTWLWSPPRSPERVRVPVVQRGAGAHLHGRCRRAGHRHGSRPACADDRHADPARRDLRDQRHRGRIGGGADGRVQGRPGASVGCSGCHRSITTSS